MKALRAFETSQGKGSRNDDFCGHYSILSTRVLAVLGDFTSDSPLGANTRLKQSLDDFVAKRLVTWREHLIPPQDILGLIARFLNKTLNQGRGGGKTTLCACIVDSHEHQLHFLNIGDSGLGIAQGGQFQFLRKGDTGGARDATGFLPLETEEFAVFEAPFGEDSQVLLFTDGFWENTAHFLEPEGAEKQIAEWMTHTELETVVEHFRDQLLARSNQRDDLTLIIVKEETVAQKSSGPNQPNAAQVEAMLEKKIFEILDRQDSLRPIPPSPMEAEFLRVLKQTATGLQGMERRILETMNKSSEQHQAKMAKRWQQEIASLSQQLKAVAEDVKDQRLRFKARVANAVSDATRDLRQLRDLANLPDHLDDTNRRLAIMETMQRQANLGQLKDINLNQWQSRLQRLEKQSKTAGPASNRPAVQAGKPGEVRVAKDPEPSFSFLKSRLWPTLNSLVLILILGWLFFFSGNRKAPVAAIEEDATASIDAASQPGSTPDPVSFEHLAQMSIAAGTETENTWPQNLEARYPPAAFLQVLGLSREHFRQELICLARAIAKSKARIQGANNPNQVIPKISIALEGCQVGERANFDLNVRSSQSPAAGTKLTPWLNQYATSSAIYPPVKNLQDLWLQIQAKVQNIDGDFGPASQAALKNQFGRHLNLDKAGTLVRVLDQWLADGGEGNGTDLMKAAGEFFTLIQAKQLESEISQLKKSLAEGQPRRNGADIFMDAAVANKTPIRVQLGRANKLTPLGSWFLANASQSDNNTRPLVLVLLSHHLGLANADGELAGVRKTLAGLAANSQDGLLAQVNSGWVKP